MLLPLVLGEAVCMFPSILNHLLLLWQRLLDSIRFISSSKEHCSVEIAETAALCNFVVALIYSEFCFKSSC